MTKKKNDLTFAESHAKLYADMIKFEEQENMGMMDEAIKETVKDKGFVKTDLKKEAMRATLKQVGGNHYKDCKIQPIEYITANNLTYAEGNIIKYVTRSRRKGGKNDLLKAKHYIEIILEMEYKDE